MKTNLSMTMRYFTLTLLLAPCLLQAGSKPIDNADDPGNATPSKQKVTLEYKSMTDFINDFFDVTKKQDKSLKWWAYQCIMLVLEDAKKDGGDDYKKQQRQIFVNNLKDLAFGKAEYSSEKERVATIVKGIKDAFTDGYLHQLFPKSAANLIIAKFKGETKDVSLKAIEMRAAKVN